MSEPDIFDLDQREREALSEETAAQDAIAQRSSDIQWLMGNPQGRRIVMTLLDATGLRKEPMTGNSNTFFNLGKAKIGRDLENEIFATCPELYLAMITENAQ